MVNSLLAILIVLMIIRDVSLLVRYRRPFRLAFVVFWVLLACAQFTRWSRLYPLIGLSLIVALVLRRREPEALAALLDAERAKQKESPPSGPGVWDREMDGGS